MTQTNSPEMCDIVVAGAVIVTGEGKAIGDGAVAVTGTRIVAVGETRAIDAAYTAARRIDAKGKILMPGLVNVHNHTPLTIVRGMVEDLGFAPAYTPGIPQGHWLSDEETYLFARLGAWELLRMGTTTAVDYYRKPQACAAALAETGLRGFVGGRIHDADTAALADGAWTHDRKLGEATLAESQAMIAAWDGKADGRIRCFHAPHAPDTCSRDLLRIVADLAATDGRQAHTHLAQSPMEVERVTAREGKGPAQLLDEIGLLNGDLVAAHCIFLNDAEIDLVGKAGINVAHAPVGNVSAGMIAPIVALEKAGATIAVCTDTKTGDMFESMRTALAVARVRGAGYACDARTVFGWATKGGAKAMAMEGEIGVLKPGAKADFILLDTAAPNLRPIVDGIGIVVHSGVGPNVSTSVIDGKVVMENGKPTLFDADAVIAAAQKAADRLWARAGRPGVMMEMV
jgi:5-methylthioadenosine/S-adenosylhomocysteine deaminase